MTVRLGAPGRADAYLVHPAKSPATPCPRSVSRGFPEPGLGSDIPF